MCRAVKKADKEDKSKLLNKVDAFIFDCDGKVCQRCHDVHPAAILRSFILNTPFKATTQCWSPAGVIWRGDSLIDGVPETLDALRKMVSNQAADKLVSGCILWSGTLKRL